MHECARIPSGGTEAAGLGLHPQQRTGDYPVLVRRQAFYFTNISGIKAWEDPLGEGSPANMALEGFKI
jgi:hypothetical protein